MGANAMMFPPQNFAPQYGPPMPGPQYGPPNFGPMGPQFGPVPGPQPGPQFGPQNFGPMGPQFGPQNFAPAPGPQFPPQNFGPQPFGPAPFGPGQDVFQPQPAPSRPSSPAPATRPAAPKAGPSPEEEAANMKAIEELLKSLGGGGGAPAGPMGGLEMGPMGGPEMGPMPMGPAGGPQSFSTQSVGKVQMQPDGSVWDMGNGSSGSSIFSLKNLLLAGGIGVLGFLGWRYFANKGGAQAVQQAAEGVVEKVADAAKGAVEKVAEAAPKV